MKLPLLDGIRDEVLSRWAASFKRRVDVLVVAGFTREEAIQILIGIFGAAVKGIKPM